MQIFTFRFLNEFRRSLTIAFQNLKTSILVTRKVTAQAFGRISWSSPPVGRGLYLVLFCTFMCFTGSVFSQANFVASPSSVSINPGDPFSVTIALQTGNSQAVDGAEIHLNFDSSILQVTGVTALSNSQLPTEILGPPSFDNLAGTISYAAGNVSSPPLANFDFLQIDFQTIGSVNTSIDYDFTFPFSLTDITLAGSSVFGTAENIPVTIADVNQPPVFNNTIANQTNNEQDIVVALDASANDPDGNSISYEATNLPAGLFIDANGLISGTIDLGASNGGSNNTGVYAVVITATDDDIPALSDSQNFQWTVTTPTVPTYTITANAGDNGSIVPLTATVNEGGSQLFTITPDNGYEVADVLINGSSVGATTEYLLENVTANTSISATFSLLAVNSAPEITLAATATVSEGGTINVPLSISDADGDNLTVTITSISNEPQELQSGNTGAQTDPYPFDASGFLTESSVSNSAGNYASSLVFTPQFGDGGSNGDGNGVYTVTVQVDDEDGNSITQDIDVTVTDVAQFIADTGTTRLEAESYDNQGPANLGSGANGIGVEVGTITNIGFTTNGDFAEYTIDVQSAGTYQFDFYVSKNSNAANTMTINDGPATITVPNYSDWTDYSNVVSANVVLTEGVQTLRFDWSGPTGFYFNMDYFEATKVTDEPFQLCIASGSGDLTAFGRSFVGDPGNPPPTGLGFTRTGGLLFAGYNGVIADATAGDETTLYQKEIYGGKTVGGGQNPPFTYEIPVANGTYQVDLYFAEVFHPSSGGRIFDVFLENNLMLDEYDLVDPIKDGISTNQTAIVRTYNVAVTDGILSLQIGPASVDNGKLSGICVTEAPGANLHPLSNIGNLDVNAAEAATALLNISDPESDALTVVLNGLPASLSYNPTSGQLEGTPLVGEVGVYTINAIISDGTNSPVTEEFTLVINPPVGNDLPVIEAIADLVVNEGETISQAITVTDDNLPVTTIEIFDVSAGGTNNPFNPTTSVAVGTLDDNTGGSYTFNWTPAPGTGRSYLAIVTANDGVNLAVSESFRINVAQQVPGTILARTFNNPDPWYGSSSPGAGYSVAIETSAAQNIGYIDNGDFVEYLVNVPAPGLFDLEVQAAKGNAGTTTVTFSENSGGGFTPIGSVEVVNNGAGWQDFAAYTTQVTFLNAGLQTLRLDFSAGANIAQFSFTAVSGNTAPVVAITSPADVIYATSDAGLSFTGTANDLDDGDLSASINWESDLDGSLGTGSTITPALSVGTHVITASATDLDGSNPKTGQASITINIVDPAPFCATPSFRVNAGGPIVFSANGDFEEDQKATGPTNGTAQLGTPSPYLDLTAPAEDTTFGSNAPLVSNDTGYPDYLFQTERYSQVANPDNMNWTFPTGNGVYEVKMLFNENWTGEINSPRVFDVEIQGNLALDDYRPSGPTGADVNVAKVETYTATVTDGVLNINFIKGTQNPSIKGFDICFVSDLPTDTPPVVSISSPTDNTTPITIDRLVSTTFTAIVEDAEDDNTTLTNALVWSIDPFEANFAGTGGTFDETLFVPGIYTIRASSTDSDTNVAFDEIQVTVLGPDVNFTAPAENADVATTDVQVTWSATNMNYEGTTPEHFHLWVNPADPNNLIAGDRISTASFPGQLFWDLTAAGGIKEGPNKVIIIAADNGHLEFLNAEARDEVNFTVLGDATNPIAVCQDITVQLDASGNASITAAAIDGGSTDNVAIDNLAVDISDFDISNVGENTVVLTVTDTSGNIATCTATVTVEDNVAPTAICQNIEVTLDANGIANITAAAIDNGSNDTAGIANLSVSLSSFSCDDIGENTVMLTVEDNNGNIASCMATVTVIDDTPPVLMDCPIDRLITSPTAQVLEFTPPSAIDACGVNTVIGTRSDGKELNEAYLVGTTTTVTWIATDNNGAVGTCQTQVTITAPVSSGKEITGFNVAGQIGDESIDSGAGTIALTVSSGTSLVGLAPTIAISNAAEISPVSGTPRDFTTSQTYTVTAEDDTTKEWTVTISVAPDTEAPVVDCPENIVVVNDPGECGAVVDFTATASDNLPGVSLEYSVASGSLFVVGTTTVIVTATDAAGLIATCNFDVTVNDTEAPLVSCPGDQTGPGDINGNFVIPDYTGLATAIDNCDDSTLVTQNPLPGTIISGTTTITITSEDTVGNSGSCTFDVTVIPEVLASLTISPSSISLKLFQGETTMVNYVVDSDDASTLPTPAAMSFIDNATSNPPTWASTTSAANQGTSYEVNFDATGLAPGTYTAILSAGPVSGYTNASIPITLTVDPIVSNAALVVLDATTDAPLFALTNGLQINKADIGNTPLGIIFNTDLNPGGVQFNLTGPIKESRYEGPAPHSLFGDIGINIQGKVFPVGNYTLVADLNVGPTITVNFSVIDENPLCANFDASLTGITNPSVCSGVGSATAVPSGGASPFTYQWDNGETTATADNLTVGPHSVIVRDANGCSKTLTFNLTGPSLPVVTLAPFANVLNTAAAFALTGGSPVGGTYSGPGVTGATFNPAIGVGTYAITYTYTDSNGCANSATQNITVTTATGNAALIVLDATTDTPLFALTNGLQISKATIGNTPLGVIFNTSLNPGGVTFSLSGPISESRYEGPAPHSLFGDIGVDIQGKVFPVGDYTLVANPNAGPTITVNFSVTDEDPLCANFDASLTGITNPSVCSGVGSATAVPSGGASPFTYQWDNGETTATADNLTVGPHSVIVRDANGCSKTLTFNLTGPALPTVTLAPFANVLNTDPAFTLTGGSPAGGTYSGPGVTGSTFNPAIGVGTYVITYSYTNSNGCTNTATRSITVTTETSNAALVVLDATTDAPLFALTNGLQINKADIGNTPLGIIFNTDLNPGGVQFNLTGPIKESRYEGPAPHSLFGDIGVDIQGKVFPVGNYTLVADPNVGPTITVNFSVIEDLSGNESPLVAKTQLNEMSIAPNPASEMINMSFDEPVLIEEILIFDVTGKLIKTIKEPLGLNSKSIDFNVYDLPIGTYFIKSIDSKGMQYQQQMLIDRY